MLSHEAYYFWRIAKSVRLMKASGAEPAQIEDDLVELYGLFLHTDHDTLRRRAVGIFNETAEDVMALTGGANGP